MTLRHALRERGLFGDGTTRCGVEGRLIALGTSGQRAVITVANYVYRIDQRTNCKRCLRDGQPTDEAREKMRLAKLGKRRGGDHGTTTSTPA